ncbi:MAG: amino acid permease [Candidatus Bathyarchaeota archaeon]|nr:amino acid permease [Candidatus Bathyarchaeota archaeon]
MAEKTQAKETLKPSLSLFDATALSIGAIIGAGIFVVTGIVAGLAGSALVVSMFIAALVSLFTAISFAELTKVLPKEGSVYEFAYQLISPSVGFLAGWMWMLSNTFVGAAVSLGFAYYLSALVPSLPVNVIAAIICLAFTVLNLVGIRQSALLNNVFVVTKLLILVLFILFGLAYVKPANFAPFAPLEIGVLQGAFYIFFAYAGFARVAVVAEEVRNAEKNVSRAILLSLLVSTIFYVGVGIVAVGLVGAGKLAGSTSPLVEAMNATENSFIVLLVSFGGLIATASVLLTSILGVSRVTFAMARRGDLPKTLSKLHPKYRTPHYSVWTVGLLMIFLVLFIDLGSVVAISTFASLFYYAIGNIAALKLKSSRRGNFKRLMSALGTLTCVGMLAFTIFVSLQSWVIGSAGLLAGMGYYAAKTKLAKNV